MVKEELTVPGLVLGFENRANSPTRSLWDCVNVLWLDGREQVFGRKFGEEVLQLGASEVVNNFLPLWRAGVVPEIWYLPP
jgi:hypothetical protein